MPSTDKILIRNGTVVNADRMDVADVLVEGNVITQVNRGIEVDKDTKVIDATGKYILPGGIDPHTHFEFEFMGGQSVDDFYFGTRAAVAGGTTTIIDFAIPRKGQSLMDCYNNYRNKADSKVVCDYALHMGVIAWDDQVKCDMKTLTEKYGINSFKVFMAYKGALMLDDSSIYKVFNCCETLGAVPMVHAENGHVIDENAKILMEKGITGPEGHALSRQEDVEAEATNRACMIAENAGSSLYVVHVMSDQAANMIAERRKKGNFRMLGETLAAGLGKTLPKSNDFRINAAHVMSPPIRSDLETPKALLNHLIQGGLQITGSDNCTFNCNQKEMGKGDFRKIPNGVNGVEDRLSVIWEKAVHTGLMKPTQFVAVTSTNAAKIFNIYPKKGCIAIGSDADLVVWNPNKTRTISSKTHHQACDFNIFEGMETHGTCDHVLVRGALVFEDGELYTTKGYGRFIPTPCFPPFVFPQGKSPCLDPFKSLQMKQIEFSCPYPIQYETLAFQDKKLVNQAIKKLSSKIHKQVLHSFRETDPKNTGTISRNNFKIVLHNFKVLGLLSSRELETLIRAFAISPNDGEDINYVSLVGACEKVYCNL